LARTSLCSSLLPHPPSAQLLPYTTLFRSQSTVSGAAIGTAVGAAVGTAVGAAAGNPGIGAAVGAGGGLLGGTAVGASNAAGANQDRKSTRLNSSHLGISYAVFCLKKKTTD